MHDTDGGNDDLVALRALGHGVSAEAVEWETPPADLWDRIAAGIAADDAPDANPHQPDGPTTVGPPPATIDVPRLADRRRSGTPWLLAAAAAVVVALGAAALVASLRTDDADQLLVAAGSLEPLAERGSGSAELVDDDGVLRLRVDTSDLGDADGFHEVWIIDTEVSRLVSLGPLRADGTYELPPGIDAADFPIVDISVEPIDGDPTHSGNSVLRGQLEF